MDSLSSFFEEYFMEIFYGLIALSIVSLIVLFYVWRFIDQLDCDLTTYAFWKYGGDIQPKLAGKVVWISGSCSGIGEQLAYDMAGLGCRLVLSGHLDTLTSIKEKCLKGSSKLTDKDILTLPPFDIRDLDRHQEMVDKVMDHFKKIDILVNNIGRSQRAKFIEIPAQVDRDIFDINVLGQVNLSRLVMRVFEAQGSGQFVITSSVAGKFGAPFSASYTASKHALQGYFETVRSEGWSKGITVTIVCPGPTLTPLIERSFHSETFEDEVRTSSSLKSGKLPVTRVSQLMLVAIAHHLQESWISLRPILWFCFTCQYFPDLSKYIMVRFLPPDKLYSMRKGQVTLDNNQNKVK